MIKNLVAILALVGLASCGNVVEEINLDADGSGTYEIKTDIIPATVNMAVTFTKMFAAMDTTHVLNEDSLRTAVTEEVWADFGDAEIDSVIDFKNEIPDSILNEGDNRKYAEKMTMFMKGSRAKGYVDMGLRYPFVSGEDLQDFMAFFERVQEGQSKNAKGNPLGELGDLRSTTTINQSNKSFARTTIYHNPADESEDMGKFKEMFGDGKFLTIVNTKRKIKKVNGDHVKSVEDYRVTFEYEFMPAMTGQLNTDFEIIFE